MIIRLLYLLILGCSKGVFSLTLASRIMMKTEVLSTRLPTYPRHYGHLTKCKQKFNSEDEMSIDPDDKVLPSPTFKQNPPKRRSADFPPLAYAESLADNLLDMPFEPEVSSILRAARSSRLVKGRSYAKRDAFEAENISSRPTLADLSPPTSLPGSAFNKAWISGTYRFGVIAASYFSFPPLTRILERTVTTTPDLISELTSKFAPGISILYGTFISLTLSILYTRLKNIQDTVATETSLISLMAQNMLVIFRDDEERMVRAGQCIADQIRILVKESRGRELMSVIYSDPYLRMLELVAEKECEMITQKDDHAIALRSDVIAMTRDTIKDVMKLRSQRLGHESLALPPTHFLILISLTTLILIGFTLSTLPDVTNSGNPSNESSILFSFLVSVYVLFFNFANDLNNPFVGVYQIRRSSAATNLLQTKWLIANHPSMQGKVEFEDVAGDIRDIMEWDDLSVWTPGLGAMMLNQDDMCDLEKPEPPNDFH